MSADLLRHSPRPDTRPGATKLRAPSSAPISGRPTSAISDSGSTISSASSTSSHRNKTLLKTYHDFAMQIFNPTHAQDVENLFIAAARDGDYERVENFLRRRSHEIVNIDVKDKRNGNTPVLLAAKNGHLKVVQLLLKYGADITIRNVDNETAIDVAKPGLRSVLLQSVDRAGCTPRHLLQAAWQGNVQVVQRLLNESKVLDINCRNVDGYTPLLLVTRDVDLFEQSKNAVRLVPGFKVGAVLENYNPQAVVKELLKHRADLSTSDAEGRTPLHFAAASKAKLSEEIAMILMSEPAILEVRDRRSLAPIHSASQSGQVEILLALLDSGADVNSRGYAGSTPLHISAYSGQLQAATKLLNHGADVTLVDDSGNTPVDVAKTKKLKFTLKEAWTEATKAKRDLVLTPVKPPSRMAESHSPSAEEKSTMDSIGSTPRAGSSLNCTPEKRIIRKMTEAHKAVLAEEQMRRDLESGRFTPSSSPRKLGLPRASSRNGTCPGKLPMPPKTPRVLDHSSGTSPGSSPEKTRKPARSLFGCRSRTHTVPGGEGIRDTRNQAARAHAKVTQTKSDPVISKAASEMPQIPVTVVGLDLDESLRDVKFRRLVSGQTATFQERRRSRERVDASVNPVPLNDSRPSSGSQGSNPSVNDVTWACMDYIQKGRKHQGSVGSCSSICTVDDESSTPPPKRVPFRANMQAHPLNLEQMHLRLSTPSPMLDTSHLFNPTSRHVIPLSPSQYSDNVQETIFEFEDEEERTENPESYDQIRRSQNVTLRGDNLHLMRTMSILNQSKTFSIEHTRVVDLNKEVSTDSGQGSQTATSISSSASTLSTPSPLLPRPDGESQYIKITNRLRVNMTPSATNVRESTFKNRTLKVTPNSSSTAAKTSSTTKIDTKETTEIPLHSARTSVVENREKASTSLSKVDQPSRIDRIRDTLDAAKSASGSAENKIRKISSGSSNGSSLGKTNTAKKSEIKIKLGNANSTKQTELESQRNKYKLKSSDAATVSFPTKDTKVGEDEKKHETVVDSNTVKTGLQEPLAKVVHKTTVVATQGTGGRNHKTVVDLGKDAKQSKMNHETAVVNQLSRPHEKADIDSIKSKFSQSSPRKSTSEGATHETAVYIKTDKTKSGSESSQTAQDLAEKKFKNAETKLLFGRLASQGSLKKKAVAKSDLGSKKTDTKANTARTSVEAQRKISTSSQEGLLHKGKPPSQGIKQGKSTSPPKPGALKAETPSNKMVSASTFSEMPKVSPRPGYNQGQDSPSGSTEKASPRIQTSKGEPSLSKSFGSGSSLIKTEIKNLVPGARENKIKSKSNPKQLCSSDEGVGLDLEENTEQLLQGQKIIPDYKISKAKNRVNSKSMESDVKVNPSKNRGQTGVIKSKQVVKRPQSTESKSDSVESIEEVYDEVVFVSDEEKGQEKSVIKTETPQEIVKVQIKEVDIVKKPKVSKLKKVVRKTAGRIIPAVKPQPMKDQKDPENKIGGISKAALKAVGKSVSEAKLQGSESTLELPLLQPSKSVRKEDTGVSKSWSSKSPNTPKTPKFPWSKWKSPEISPRSDSSFEIPHDPRVIKEHTPVIQDVMEYMQTLRLQSDPSPIPWKPRQKITSTSSCPVTSDKSLAKTRRRISSTKEAPKRSTMKGSLRKMAIMGQNAQKGKVGRPGSGGKSRPLGKKKRDLDAISTQRKAKPRTSSKPKAKGNVKPNKLHLLSESDTATKAFITGQGWHIQTEKNETSDVIIHDRSALDGSSDSEEEALKGLVGSPKLSPHNTLVLSKLCEIHPLSPAVINNIANIMSPLEENTPRFIPDTMGAIKEFGDSLKSTSSSEPDQQQRFTFEKESFDKLAAKSDSKEETQLNFPNNSQSKTSLEPSNQASDAMALVEPERITNEESRSREGSHVSSTEGRIIQDGDDIKEKSGSATNTPRIVTSESQGNQTERSDISYGNGEDLSSYETNPEFLKVFRLKDPESLDLPHRRSSTEDKELPEPSSEHEPECDIRSEKISHKPPLPSKPNVTISELTRVPRGSIKRRYSEPPAKASDEKKHSDEVHNLRQFIQVKNSWREDAETENHHPVFEEERRTTGRSKWKERSQVEDMVSPLKSRLPDKNFSPPASSKESPTRRRGNSMPEVVNQGLQKDSLRNNKEMPLEEASNLNLPSQRKHSAVSQGSDVFLNDMAAADDKNSDSNDDEEDATLHDKEQILTEHVQHLSMSAIQELNTVLSQSGDVHFEFPSPSTLRPSSRDGDTESVAFEPDWFNQSLTASEASEVTLRTLSAMSNEMHNTHSSGLSSERSHSSSTNFSEPEGGLLHWKKGNILGRGAFGVVFCGLTNTGQLIAVKQVELSDKDSKNKSRQQYEKLQEEVELLKTLRHRNIVGFLGVSLEGSTVNIFMQYIPGGSIASLLARFGALEEPVFCRYTKQILQGTEYLHSKNVIHRDIKGANIMLMSNGVIKLIDFGCAKRLCINISQSQNLLKSMRGTPYWMAPEVIMETGHGKKSDIWSVGCTVFEMATRKPPWSEMPPMSAIFAIGSGGPIPQLPEKFSCFAREFVNTCLTRDQNERPTATQLLTHSFIRKRREHGRDRFETRISSSTMEEANITFKEQPGSRDRSEETGKQSRRNDYFS